MTGTIKFYTLRFYGMIDVNEETDIFFHRSGLQPNYLRPEPGDQVEFNCLDAARGRKAVNIKLVKRAVHKPYTAATRE